MDRAAFETFSGLFHEPLLLVSAEGSVLHANSAVEQLAGVSAGGLRGRSLAELVADDAASVKQQLSRFARSRQALPGTLRWRQPDGTVLALRCEGAVAEPRRDGVQAQIAIRLRPRSEAVSRFSVLNQKIDSLSHEIQERRRIERSLRESQEWLRFTQSCAQAGSWEWEISTGRLVWSEEFYRLCGLDPGAAPATGWGLVAHPEDRERVMEATQRAVESRSGLDVEFRIMHPERGERWLASLGRTVYSDSGRPIRMAGIAFDITARKRAEIAANFLAEAGAELSSSLDYETTLRKVAQMVVPRLADWCAVDIREPEGPIRRLAVTHVDPAKVRLAHEIEQRWPTDLDASRGLGAVLRSGTPDIVPEITTEMLREGTASDEHFAMINALGLRSYLCVPLAAHQRVLGVITLAYAESGRRYNEDDLRIAMELASRAATAIENARLYAAAQAEIVDRRRAEEQLARQSEITRAITHNAASCLIMVDERGHPTYMNPAAESVCGYTLDELAAQPLWQVIQFVPEEGAPVSGADSPLASAIQSMHPFRDLEDVFRRKDGTFFPVSCSIAPILQGRHRLGAVVDFRDVTLEREAQEELRRHADELARSNAELQDFAYLTSHDLKEPLRGISTSAGFLLEDHGDRLGEDGREKLQSLVRLSKRMYHLLDALLDHGRLSRVPLQIAEHDMAEIAREVVTAMQDHLDAQGARVTIGPLPRVRCDRTLAAQLITGLVSNAVRFNTSERKHVEIGSLIGGVADRTPVVYIRDNGIGIARQHLASIFRMFRRLHHRDQFGGGLGVGLALAKRIVERHGGRIWAESAGNEAGATFYFTLQPGRFRRPVRADSPAGVTADVENKSNASPAQGDEGVNVQQRTLQAS